MKRNYRGVPIILFNIFVGLNGYGLSFLARSAYVKTMNTLIGITLFATNATVLSQLFPDIQSLHAICYPCLTYLWESALNIGFQPLPLTKHHNFRTIMLVCEPIIPVRCHHCAHEFYRCFFFARYSLSLYRYQSCGFSSSVAVSGLVHHYTCSCPLNPWKHRIPNIYRLEKTTLFIRKSAMVVIYNEMIMMTIKLSRYAIVEANNNCFTIILPISFVCISHSLLPHTEAGPYHRIM